MTRSRRPIKKLTNIIFLLVFFLAALAAVNTLSPVAKAAYQGHRLIDNHIFLNANSMSKSKIQKFLEDKNSGLKDMELELQCYGPGSKERQWYTDAGAECDTEIPVSHIIYYAARIYGVNPKVILATMQKEQSLVTTPNPSNSQLNKAMGYICPSSCPNNNLSYQIDSGTWVLRFHYERARGNMTWWRTDTGWTCGTEKNYYKPNLYPNNNTRFYDGNGVHYRTYNIANAATSSLYCYTPHAYNNPEGLHGLPKFGTKGQYYAGSYNFVIVFEHWFGSTQSIIATKAFSAIEKRHDKLGDSDGVMGGAMSGLRNDGKTYWIKYENGYIVWGADSGAWESMGPIRDRWKEMGLKHSRLGLPSGPVKQNDDGTIWQKYQGGYIIGEDDRGYWESMNGIRARWEELGLRNSVLGYPAGPVKHNSDDNTWQKYEHGYIIWNRGIGSWESYGDIRGRWEALGLKDSELGQPAGPVTSTGDNDGLYQKYQNGYIIWSQDTGAWESLNGPIRDRWGELGRVNGTLGYPVGSVEEAIDGSGKYQEYQNGYIVWSEDSGAWESPNGPIRNRWIGLGQVNGVLGYPVEGIEQTADNDGLYQKYQNGYIIWSQDTGAWESLNGPIRDRWGELGRVNGTLGYPTGPVVSVGDELSQAYQGGTIYYSPSEGTWVVHD